MKKTGMKIKLLRTSLFVAAILLTTFSILWAASSGGHGEVHNAWTSNDTWKTLNFALLAIGVIFIASKILPSLLRSRAKGIEDEIKALESKKAEAEKNLADYQAKFKNIEQESKQIISDYIKQGQEAKTRIIESAEAQAEKLEEMAKRNIEQEFKSARMKLQQEIVEKAIEKAQEVIVASISSDDQDKLVDEYLKKVVA
ncbi:MAG: ATP synthase F0 subunit B [Proteobacteria bacterium]|nr:ATP synthase F0 subunit B [Pseudomonadota bacterium]MBU1387636.1 ATP synthase F0 subunit B [Pseudomonadota bacterium]MBU1544227.1 ATP synthase F0 subunit B [Pseudomonadota bacterium]